MVTAEGTAGPPEERAAPGALRSFTPAERGPGVTTGQRARRTGMRCPVLGPVAPPGPAAADGPEGGEPGTRSSARPGTPALAKGGKVEDHSACRHFLSTFSITFTP